MGAVGAPGRQLKHTAYAPSSASGWLDLDAAASERAATLLRAFAEPTTLDPLGLGAVRDAFSDLFAPGLSTIQTRLRYFLFVPWICQELEGQRVSPGEFPNRLRDREARLIDCLRHLGPAKGVQGFHAGRKLQRMPSEAYWSGLSAWGIRRLDLSRSEYARQAAVLGRQRAELDDDGNPVATGATMWSPTLPPAPDDFLDAEIDFALTEEEAVALVDHIRHHQPSSLLAAACRFPSDAAEAANVWDVPTDGVSEWLREGIEHARCLSELTLGPQHVYNLLLARRAASELGWDTEPLADRVEAQLADWVDLVGERIDELQAWAGEVDEFWAYLAPHATVPTPTITFVEQVVTRAARDPEAFVEDPVGHTLVRDREIRLKGSRARLGQRSALETWNQDPFGGPLVYRWPIARSYLADLGAALSGATTSEAA